MDQDIQAFMVEYEVPGLSIAIAKDDSIVLSSGFGVVDRETAEPVTERSRFRIASISKPITAVAILRLVEEGKLRLEDRVFGAEGALRRPPAPNSGGEAQFFWAGLNAPHLEAITIEHLLTHTAGGWQNDANDPMFQHPEMNHTELIALTLETQPLEHAPGENYAYSNFGYCLLGRIIERVSGEAYDAAVRRLVLEPCGVHCLAIANNLAAERQADEVVYYGQEGNGPYERNVTRMDSHGGWIASASDLVRFAVRVNGFPQAADILREETIRRMSTGSAANPGYGLGWAVNDQGSWWHGGSLPGTATILMRTASGYSWAALANTRRPGLGADLDKLMWKVAEQF